MSLSVKISGEDVANLSATAGENDTEMGFHTYRLYQAMVEFTLGLQYSRCS
jgi:hypothetical protein